MSVRLARDEDIPIINLFVRRSIQALHVEHYSADEIRSAVRLAYGVDWQVVRDGTYYVFEADGVIAGAGGWSYRHTIGGSHGPDEPPSPHLDPSIDSARVRAFYVDPDYVRRGIGSKILDICEEAARQAGFKRADLTSTLQAVPFYLARGYTIVEPVDLPFTEGFVLRTQLMRKRLDCYPTDDA